MIRKIQPIMNMKENKSVAKNLELHILQWNKHMQKRVIVIQSFKIKAETLLLRKFKTIMLAIWQKIKTKNGSEQIPPQYETVNPKSQIKNIETEHTLHSFTSTNIHGHIPTRIAIPKPTAKQPKTHTRNTIKRERSQEEKRVWEREIGRDYSVLQFENLEKKTCNDLFERERNWVRGSTNLSNISSLCRIRKLHVHSLLNCGQEFLPCFCRNNKVIWSMNSAQVHNLK